MPENGTGLRSSALLLKRATMRRLRVQMDPRDGYYLLKFQET